MSIQMAKFKRRQLEFGLEFVHRSYPEHNGFSKGFSEPKKDARVIRVRGRQPNEFLTANYLFLYGFTCLVLSSFTSTKQQTVTCCTPLYCILYSTVLYTVLYCILCSIVLYSVPHSTANCTPLYYILYSILLYSSILHVQVVWIVD